MTYFKVDNPGRYRRSRENDVKMVIGWQEVILGEKGNCCSNRPVIMFVSKKSGRKCNLPTLKSTKNEMKVVWIQEMISSTTNHVIIVTLLHMIYR